MNDLIMIVIRFLLYLDLMVIFGLPFFQIYGISGVRHETYNLTNFRSFITFAVVTGIILTGINMLLVSNAMSGVTDLRELSIHVIEMVIEETDVVLAGLSGSVPCLPHSVLCSFTLIREYCPAC